MTEAQVVLLALMKEFDRICQEHGVQYFYAGGTALGALRNEGFLPWDDDVDVLLTRSNYERLDRAMQELSGEDYLWVTEDNHPCFHYPTARFFDMHSTDLYESRLDYGAPVGLQIDVFIMDPFPEERERQIDFMKHLWLYGELSADYLLYARPSTPAEMLDGELYRHYRERIQKEGLAPVKAEIKQHILYPEEGARLWCGRWSSMPYIFEASWIEEPRYLPFEDYSIPVMKGVIYEMIENYDRKWDIVPPAKERTGHFSYTAPHVSFEDKREAIHALCEANDYNTLLGQSKQDRVERILAQQEIDERFSRMKQAYLTVLGRRLGERSWDFSLEKEREYREAFREYFLAQFKAKYKKFRLAVPLHEDLLGAMLLSLIHEDRIDDAFYLLSLYPDSGEHAFFRGLLHDLSELKVRKYEGKEEEVARLLGQIPDRYGLRQQVEVERAALWRASLQEETEEGLALYERCRHREDPELRKYAADLLRKAGEEDAAMEIYRSVARESRNGMILHALEKEGIRPEAPAENGKAAKAKTAGVGKKLRGKLRQHRDGKKKGQESE